ncbi:hypothetical protein N9190_00710 [bacterium]|nr:hypothetical protein [Akkermansiaceae bacterium]MDB4410605.1 hypothetical protein [bacterium]MDB4574254.1 hypothetical protein [Akkermansiaceae bacterium]MDC0267106.1 hypothetical protein [Akkermansiaceae bacterium]
MTETNNLKDKNATFLELGLLPSEIPLVDRGQLKTTEERDSLRAKVLEELKELLLDEKGFPSLTARFEDIIQRGDFKEQASTYSEQILPKKVATRLKDQEKSKAFMIAEAEVWTRNITSSLANHLKDQLVTTKEMLKEQLQMPFPNRTLAAELDNRLDRIFGLIFALGQREQLQRQHTETIHMLPWLVRGVKMDQSLTFRKDRKNRQDNIHLKQWVQQIVTDFRKETGAFPTRKQLPIILRNQIERLNQPGMVSISTSSPDSKERLQHRKDAPAQGVTFSTITDTWLRDFRASHQG